MSACGEKNSSVNQTNNEIKNAEVQSLEKNLENGNTMNPLYSEEIDVSIKGVEMPVKNIKTNKIIQIPFFTSLPLKKFYTFINSFLYSLITIKSAITPFSCLFIKIFIFIIFKF